MLQKAQPPKAPDCGGPVRAVGVNVTGIVGLGITISVGKVTVNRSGESSWFISAGFGAGLDAGISGFGTYYKDLSSFSGYGESYNGSVAVGTRSIGGSLSYNVDGKLVGGSVSGSGLPGLGLRAGASGTASDTTLLSGRCQ
jgi:hypothetical protein